MSDRKVPRKNQKPEAKVVNASLLWLNEMGFSCCVVDAAATFSISAGRYLRGMAKKGMTDIVGVTPTGYGTFIEIKALGKLNTLKDHQKEFIREKILKGSFSIVTDSAQRLKDIYTQWHSLKLIDNDKSIAYLLDKLPKKRKSRDSGLFD